MFSHTHAYTVTAGTLSLVVTLLGALRRTPQFGERIPKLPAHAALPFQVLAHAETFAIGPVGFAGIVPDEALAWRVLLRDSGAAGAFYLLAISGSPAARVYGLVGLQATDSVAFASLRTLFLQSRTWVPVQRGCVGWDVPAAALRHSLDSRELLRALAYGMPAQPVHIPFNEIPPRPSN